MAHDQTETEETQDAGGDRPGAMATFPFDRMTIERFRASFPPARWRNDLEAWFVPGVRAERRIDRWLARELGASFAFADERGRDAFAFDPIDSIYLTAGDDLRIVTPYSRTIVAELREVPWARCWCPMLDTIDNAARMAAEHGLECAVARAEAQLTEVDARERGKWVSIAVLTRFLASMEVAPASSEDRGSPPYPLR